MVTPSNKAGGDRWWMGWLGWVAQRADGCTARYKEHFHIICLFSENHERGCIFWKLVHLSIGVIGAHVQASHTFHTMPKNSATAKLELKMLNYGYHDFIAFMQRSYFTKMAVKILTSRTVRLSILDSWGVDQGMHSGHLDPLDQPILSLFLSTIICPYVVCF